MKRAAALVAVIALTTSMAAAQTPMKTISKGDVSDQETPRQVVARTNDEWQAVWKAHSATAPLPPVDFSTQMVVGVFLGSRPSAGYEVEITGTHTEGSGLVVEYTQTEPARGMMGAQMITEPYHLVSIPKHADPIRFVEIKGK